MLLDVEENPCQQQTLKLIILYSCQQQRKKGFKTVAQLVNVMKLFHKIS
jgi:hypothetical protein